MTQESLLRGKLAEMTLAFDKLTAENVCLQAELQQSNRSWVNSTRIAVERYEAARAMADVLADALWKYVASDPGNWIAEEALALYHGFKATR